MRWCGWTRSPIPRFADPLVVNGPGISALTVSGNDLFRIFRVEKPAVEAPIDVTLAGLTLTHGSGLPVAGSDGGAVLALDENLTILNRVISKSRSAAGGGGGAFESFLSKALLTIESSTIAGNSAGGGGGLSAFGGGVQIFNSTFSGNSVSGDGGAIFSSEGNLEIWNSTISGNQAQMYGGGIAGVARSSFA